MFYPRKERLVEAAQSTETTKPQPWVYVPEEFEDLRPTPQLHSFKAEGEEAVFNIVGLNTEELRTLLYALVGQRDRYLKDVNDEERNAGNKVEELQFLLTEAARLAKLQFDVFIDTTAVHREWLTNELGVDLDV